MFIPVPFSEIRFSLSKFSGGELNFKLNNNIDYSNVDKVVITHRIHNSDDIMAILIASDALKLKGVKDIDLIIPYIPYARQDRICNEGESFSLKVFANLINSVDFNKVYCLDAHSDVSVALINNCINMSNTRYVDEVLKDIDNPTLISPDAGSNKKANKLAKELGFDKLVKCDKVRNLSDGKLSGFEVFTDDLEGRDCLIVDDICDGGGTFIGLAMELKKKNAGKIYLFCTHGIFSRGVHKLLYYHIDKIYCTNSFKDIEIDGVVQYKIQL
jgi:ribose-phosphate pyrophosphokinase